MHRTRPIVALAAATALAAGALSATTQTASAAPAYTVTTLHFAVATGADGKTPCDVVGDLYLPTSATAKKQVPAILTTNGFGGSKDDQAGIGKAFASRGYAVLSYSGLGFGGSTCKITLDDPDVDGRAASQLVSYLGGRSGIAFTDAKHTTPAPTLKVVKRDAKDHRGKAAKNDPRVGMVGGSYGGQIQYAAAAVDPRIDTIVPIITWNDLSYSLAPNNTSQTAGVQTAVPGAAKLVWALGFSALGVVDGLQNAPADPGRLLPCPNFADFVCPTLLTAATTGALDATGITNLRHASVASYVKKIKIPTLILQGQHDTLFNLNEATATYRALQAQGTEVKMIWQKWGHSDNTPAPGEVDLANPDPKTQYETARIAAWFDRYLRGKKVSTGPEFAYFRDWVTYQGIATPAYATSKTVSVGKPTTYFLSGTELASSKSAIKTGSQTFVTPLAGLPTSSDKIDVIGEYVPLPEVDLPGTSASWTTPTLTKKLDVVGSPRLTLQVNAPGAAATQAIGTTGRLVLFAKVLDVDAAGKASVVKDLVAPVRVADVTKPFTVTLPGIVHRFAPGHSLRLVVSGGSTNYRGGLTPNAVTVTTGSAAQALTLPVVP